MGYRYTNEVEGGQVIESDDLVPHLEGQALWVRTVIGDPDPELVPDETWTDEALDALGKERGITWRSNASKATKVAKLTEG